ncbi:MAG: hypothetical protein LBS57_10130 [Treponema sp.]|jgi:hypothetical protein|nr:hypothetical protein [Treponema sp.]
MNEKWKVMALAALTGLILTLSLNAQTGIEKPAPESNKSAATQGNFGAEVDDFLDVHSWDGVLGDSKWFAYAGYGDYLQLGYARAFGGIYVSAFYGGNIVSFAHPDKSESLEVKYDGNGNATDKTTTTDYGEAETHTNNNIDILVGFANMGITVGFFEDLEVKNVYSQDFVKTETIGTNTVDYSDEGISADAQEGWLLPSIGWGMTLGLGNLTVKPYVNAAVGFRQDYKEEETKDHTTVNGTVAWATTNISGNKDNYVNPFFSLGADLDFSDNFGIGLEYGIGFDVYSNDYDVAGQSGTVKGTVDYGSSSQAVTRGPAAFSYVDTADLSFTEKSAIRHAILPSLWYANAAGDLEFGLYFELPFGIETSSDKSWSKKTVVTYSGAYLGDPTSRTTSTEVTTSPGDTVDTSVFVMAPFFSAGATYPLIRDRLFVNAGVGVSLPTLLYETTATKPGGFEKKTSKTVNDKGEVTAPETVTITPDDQTDEVTSETFWAGLSAEISAGFTFNFNQNFSVDLLAATSFGKQRGAVDFGGVDYSIELEEEEKGPFDINTSRFSVIFTIKK